MPVHASAAKTRVSDLFFFRPTPDGSRQVVYQACETLFATEPLQTHVRQPFNKAAQRLCAN